MNTANQNKHCLMCFSLKCLECVHWGGIFFTAVRFFFNLQKIQYADLPCQKVSNFKVTQKDQLLWIVKYAYMTEWIVY